MACPWFVRRILVIYLDGSDNEIAALFFVAINDLASELLSRPARIEASYAKLPQAVGRDFEKVWCLVRRVRAGVGPLARTAPPRS